MSAENNLDFTPKSISAPGIGPGEGATIRVAIGIVQRTTALRAYNSFTSGRDWLEKLATAYVVAIATRSADTLLMQHIQDSMHLDPPFICNKCKESTIGLRVIRDKAFPVLGELRRHANKLIHHLDQPKNVGVSALNVEGVFDYCHHLFEENACLLLGEVPDVALEFRMCKDCRTKA